LDSERELHEHLLRFAMDGAQDALQMAMGFIRITRGHNDP
jgi:hypothetical protein